MQQHPHSTVPTSRTASGSPAIHVAAIAERNGWRPEQFGEAVSGIPLVAWWPTSTPTRVVWAAIHGEESVTLQALSEALRTVRADEACAVVVPVLNPDGVLAGTRQNARGVDLNRNFPGSNWSEEPQPTFWPTTTLRSDANRTQLSSPGSAPASEPEVQAITALVERVEPELVVDLHTPLECVIALGVRAAAVASHFAEPAGLDVVEELDSPTPGDAGTWCEERGIAAVTYEFELAPLPVLWARHAAGITRCLVEQRFA